MNSMPNLSKDDQQHAQLFGQQAAEWFQLFDCINPSVIGFPDKIRVMDRLEIIGALHRMNAFSEYVHPFLKDDDRMTAFEDASALAIYEAIIQQQVVN